MTKTLTIRIKSADKALEEFRKTFKNVEAGIGSGSVRVFTSPALRLLEICSPQTVSPFSGRCDRSDRDRSMSYRERSTATSRTSMRISEYWRSMA